MMKTIMLVINQGFTTRYLLRSNIFHILKRSGVRIIILSPAAKENYFIKEFFGENVYHELYEPKKYRDKKSKIYQFFTHARLYSFNSKYYNNFTNYWRVQYFKSRENVSFVKKTLDLMLKLTIFILSRSMVARKIFTKIESLITQEIHRPIFRKYKPDIVITTSMGTLPYDRFIMQEAKKNGSKIVSLILSWDNTTTKGISGAPVDYVVAWTEIMRNELIKYHDLPSNRIFVGGVVQYEEYFKKNNLTTKKDLFKQLHLARDKKTIFFCLESPTAYKWNPDILHILAEKIKNNEITSPCQLIVRPHPIYFRVDGKKLAYEKDLNELKKIEKEYSFIKFDYPEILSNCISHDMPESETYKLGALIKYSDVLLCFYSSMNIEASIFDTPIINIELYHKRNLPNKVMANHAHNKRVLSTGGVKSVTTRDELIKSINNYLDNPNLDSKGRSLIAEQETGINRGFASQEIANYLLKLG
jgi:CDP-glycerol glycerophosphotransferase (TagB/SpsB family)